MENKKKIKISNNAMYNLLLNLKTPIKITYRHKRGKKETKIFWKIREGYGNIEAYYGPGVWKYENIEEDTKILKIQKPTQKEIKEWIEKELKPPQSIIKEKLTEIEDKLKRQAELLKTVNYPVKSHIGINNLILYLKESGWKKDKQKIEMYKKRIKKLEKKLIDINYQLEILRKDITKSPIKKIFLKNVLKQLNKLLNK